MKPCTLPADRPWSARIPAANSVSTRARVSRERLACFYASATLLMCACVLSNPVSALGNLVPGGQDRYTEARIGVGEFRSHCSFSHRATHDPIVAPGNPDFMHSHDFFGNTSTNFASTTASLSAHHGTSCDPAFPPSGGVANGPAEDSAAYWVPSLVSKTTGEFVDPTRFIAYYFVKRPSDPLQLKSIPQGLRMIAGNAHASGLQDISVASWNCIGDSPQYSEIPECGSKTLQMLIYFPECWDGFNLDSPNHRSHLAYRGGDGCPASHPVLIPKLELQIQYERRPPGELYVDSDKMMNTSRGRTAHADFINTWFAPAFDFRMERCLMWPVVCFTEGIDVRRIQNRWPADLAPPHDPDQPAPTRATNSSYMPKSSAAVSSARSSSTAVSSRSQASSIAASDRVPTLKLAWPSANVTVTTGSQVAFWGTVADADAPSLMATKIAARIRHIDSGEYLLADGSWSATPGTHPGAVVAADGHWRVMHLVARRSGLYQLEVTATDTTGNVSSSSTSYRVQ